jgi:hypothetical protein
MPPTFAAARKTYSGFSDGKKIIDLLPGSSNPVHQLFSR